MGTKFVTIFGLVILLAGCAHPSPIVDSAAVPSPSELEPDPIQLNLTAAAMSVSKSLKELTAIEKAVHPEAQLPPPPNPASIGMARLASVNWTGPLEPLVRKIAVVTNYRVRIVGNRPPIPPITPVLGRNTPLADILRDASFKAAKKAEIVLYPQSRVIEIRYYGT